MFLKSDSLSSSKDLCKQFLMAGGAAILGLLIRSSNKAANIILI